MLRKHLDLGPGSQSLFGNRANNNRYHSACFLLTWAVLLSPEQVAWLWLLPGPGKARICSREPGACRFWVGASGKCAFTGPGSAVAAQGHQAALGACRLGPCWAPVSPSSRRRQKLAPAFRGLLEKRSNCLLFSSQVYNRYIL